MTSGLGVLLATFVFYFVIALFIRDREASFYTTTNTRFLWVSISTAYLSVAGGILALTSGSDYYGIWILIAPISSILALVVFFYIYKNLKLQNNEQPFSIISVENSISSSPKNASFAIHYSLALSFVYIFLLGWELYVGGTVLSFLIFSESTIQVDALEVGQSALLHAFGSPAFILASITAITSILYISIGGYAKVVITDFVQFIIIIIFLVALVWNLIFNTLSDLNLDFYVEVFEQNLLIYPSYIELLVFSLIALNLVTQPQLPQLWQAAQSSDQNGAPDHVRTMLFKAGLVISIGWILIIIVAFLTPVNPELGGTNSWLRIVDFDNWILRFIAIIGIGGLMLSSIDSLIMGISNHVENAFNRSAVAKQVSDGWSRSFSLRALIPVYVAMALTFAYGLQSFTPNIFVALIGITSSLTIFAPVFFVSMFGIKVRFNGSLSWRLTLAFVFMTIAHIHGVIEGLSVFVLLLPIIGLGIGATVLMVSVHISSRKVDDAD